MATYEEIYGKRVEVLDADPTLNSSYEGQVWYNSASGTLKTVVTFASATSQAGLSRSPSETMKQMASASGGPSDANWVAGGNTFIATTEEWNGSGWSAGGDLNTAGLNRSGFGTLPAGVCCGGLVPGPAGSNATEEYNGSSWSNGNNMPEVNRGLCGGGTLTAGIMYSGHANPSYSVASDKTKYYDGTNWSVPPATMNTARANMSGCGTQTAALGVSGESGPTPSAPTAVEEYNGTTWTAAPSLNTGRGNQGPATCQGSTTNATMLGGNPPPNVAIENYNGTAWSTNPTSLATGQSQSAGFGASGDSIGVFGGANSMAEEYSVSINTITAAAWAAGTASNTGRYIASGVGSNTAALVYGGVFNPGTSLKNETEEWNGTSWSEESNLGTARFGIGQGIGTQTAALAYGGYTTTIVANVEEYNGASWSEETNMPAPNRIQGGFGTQTAGVSAAGQGSPGKWTNSYEYNGTGWTSATAYPTAVEQMAGCGTETAGLISGGSADPGLVSTQNAYNGASWTAGGALLTTLAFQNNNGTQTACQIIGGGVPSYTTAVSTYDGTSVSTAPSLATARGYGRGTTTSGAVTGAIITSGSIPPQPSSNTSEEFTTETSAINVKTLTQS